MGSPGRHESSFTDDTRSLFPCPRCGSDEWAYCDYGGCSECRSYEDRAAEIEEDRVAAWVAWALTTPLRYGLTTFGSAAFGRSTRPESLPDPFSDAAGCLEAAKQSIAMAQDFLEAEFDA